MKPTEDLLEETARHIVEKIRTMAVDEMTRTGCQYTDQQYRAVTLKLLRPVRERMASRPHCDIGGYQPVPATNAAAARPPKAE